MCSSTSHTCASAASCILTCTHAALVNMQEFSWTEEDLPRAKAERGESLDAEAAAALAKEPMFCFEVCTNPAACWLLCNESRPEPEAPTPRPDALQTCLKMLYWSKLMYAYEEVRPASIFLPL